MNPGASGKIASGDIPTCNGLAGDWNECGIDPGPATPSVSRFYRGIELFARKSLGDRHWVQASYVFSSLRGNYDGAVNQGVTAGSFGQTLPGFNADFDYPQMYHNAYGILALDRPHRFRVDGYWVTPWRTFSGPSGVRRVGRAAQPAGLLRTRTPARPSFSFRADRRAGCRRCWGPI